MRKIIVMDMDGTLLTSKKQISQNTKEVLWQLQEQGHTLILASGRVKDRLDEFAKQLKMDKYNGFLIEANGAAIYEYGSDTREILREMSHDEVQEVHDFMKANYPSHEVLVMADVNAYVFLPDGQKESNYFNTNNMESLRNRQIFYVQDVKQINERIFKVCTFDTPEVIEKMNWHFQEALQHAYWCGRTMPFWLEVTPKEISKGKGLQQILKQLDCQPEDVYAFGDGENDISMLEFTNGVAMANAIDSVKAVCQYECDSNDEDGIASFLKQQLG